MIDDGFKLLRSIDDLVPSQRLVVARSMYVCVCVCVCMCVLPYSCNQAFLGVPSQDLAETSSARSGDNPKIRKP